MSDILRGVSIFLVGMMGSGKTTVGEILAQDLHYRFFDTDVLVERVAAKTIREIFVEAGEESFRELESQILAQLCAETRSVIATGGGIILRQLNWSYLRHGLIIWLDAPVSVLVARLQADSSRPLLDRDNLEERLTHLLDSRRAFYSQADLVIPVTATQTPRLIVAAILDALPGVIKVT
jgi:shikimate kinase